MATHILVIGATGPSGLAFCHAALSRGYSLTLYVRNPDKLPADVKDNANVSVVKGTLEDVSGFQQAAASAASGPSVFVSFAGPMMSSKGTPITDAMKHIFPTLVANNYKRAMVLGTCSFPTPEDKGGIKWKALVTFIKTIVSSAYEEFNGLGAFVTSQDVSELKWTLFRVPFLHNGASGPVNATYTGSGSDGMFLSRNSLASWVLDEMGEDSAFVGQAPVLSG